MNQQYYEQLPEEEQRKFDALKKEKIESQKNYYLDDSNAEFTALKKQYEGLKAEDEFIKTFEAREDSENDLSTHIKLEINNLIWMYASEETTLKDAEAMASRWWLELMENREKTVFDKK